MNKQNNIQKERKIQKVLKLAYEQVIYQVIYKSLYYPKTQTNRKLFEIQGLNVEDNEMYLQLKFDLSAWINLNMIIKLRQHEINTQPEDQIESRIIFFSRPLMREIIKYFLIQVKQLEENKLFLISLDYQEIWINYKIIKEQIQFKKIVILNEFSNDEINFEEHKSKINEVIGAITKQFKIDDFQFYFDLQSDDKLIQYIDNKLNDKQAEFNTRYKRPYNQTDLRKLMRLQQNKRNKQISFEQKIQENFFFELYLFEALSSIELKQKVLNKINELEKQIQTYNKQYDVVLKELPRSEQLKNQICEQLLEGLKSQKYLNYLDNFIKSTFNFEACIQKSWIQTQFQQLIIEEESLMKRYCLYKMMIELSQIGSEKKFLVLSNYITQLQQHIKNQLKDLVIQMATHLNLNQEITHHLQTSKRFDYVFDAISSILIENYQVELNQNKQIQYALQHLIPDIKRTLYELLQEYIDNL